MVGKLMSNNSPHNMKPIIEQLVNNTMLGEDCKLLVQQMLNTTVDLKTKKTPNSTRKSPTGNQVNLLLRAMLNDGISTERLDKYATTNSGLTSGDTSNIQKMLFQVASKYNCLATTEQGTTCDQNMLVNALDTIVQAFVDDQAGSKPTTNSNPFADVQPTATATTTIEQIDEEFEEEEEEQTQTLPLSSGVTLANVKHLTNDIIEMHSNGQVHPVVTEVRNRLLAQPATQTTYSNGTSMMTVQLFLNGKNATVGVHKLSNGTEKMKSADEYFLFTSACTIGLNVMGLYSKRGGGRFSSSLWANKHILNNDVDNFSVGAFGVAVMHLAQPQMVDKNGNRLGFNHDLRKYVDSEVVNFVRDVFINNAIANSAVTDGSKHIANSWNMKEYTVYDSTPKFQTPKKLL